MSGIFEFSQPPTPVPPAPHVGKLPPWAQGPPRAQGIFDRVAATKFTLNGVEYVGEPWRVTGRLILNGGGTVGDADAQVVETATGIAYTPTSDGGSPYNQDLVTFDVPDGQVCLVRRLQVVMGDELAWDEVALVLIAGGAPNQSNSAPQGRVLQKANVEVVRNDWLDLDYAVDGPTTIRLQGSNGTVAAPSESAHIIEVDLRGSLFPKALFDRFKRQNFPGGA